MDKYTCTPCGWEYDPAVGDPDNGVAPGTAWEDVPEDIKNIISLFCSNVFSFSNRIIYLILFAAIAFAVFLITHKKMSVYTD